MLTRTWRRARKSTLSLIDVSWLPASKSSSEAWNIGFPLDCCVTNTNVIAKTRKRERFWLFRVKDMIRAIYEESCWEKFEDKMTKQDCSARKKFRKRKEYNAFGCNLVALTRISLGQSKRAHDFVSGSLSSQGEWLVRRGQRDWPTAPVRALPFFSLKIEI